VNVCKTDAHRFVRVKKKKKKKKKKNVQRCVGVKKNKKDAHRFVSVQKLKKIFCICVA
jgi:hypothetical protein